MPSHMLLLVAVLEEVYHCLCGLCSWDYFLPAYNCPLKEKVGIVPRLGDNGKWLCGVRTLLQKDNCIVYSVGSNGETSFEQDLLRRTNCEVHIFDPTLPPDVLEQVRSIKGVTVHTYGLGPSDGTVSPALGVPHCHSAHACSRFPQASMLHTHSVLMC